MNLFAFLAGSCPLLLLSSSSLVDLANAQPSSGYEEAFAYATELVDGNDNPVLNITNNKYGKGVTGGAIVRIQPNETNVQTSNYDWRKSTIANVGNKSIVAIYIDLSNAIFPDVVYDNDGSGGDDVKKNLTHDWGSVETLPVSELNYTWQWQPARGEDFDRSAPFDPAGLADVDNLFVDELSDYGVGAAGGYKGLLILYQGFDYNETYDFSIDIDSNSLAGLSGGAILGGAEWDVGGVSGAEMIGSVVTLLFDDDTTASGTLASDGSQAGAVAYVTDAMTADAPEVTVGGTTVGDDDVATYCQNLTVSVSGATNQTVQVTMIKAFNPVVSLLDLANMTITAKALVAARLNAQFPEFPANNARELQHAVLTLTNDTEVDITSSFALAGINDTLAFSAVVIDAAGLPMSDVSDPVYLVYVDCLAPPTTMPVAANGTAAPAAMPVAAGPGGNVTGPGGNVTGPSTKAPKRGQPTAMPVMGVVAPTTAPVAASPVVVPTATNTTTPTTNTTTPTTTKTTIMPVAKATAPASAPAASPSSGCYGKNSFATLLVASGLAIVQMLKSA